MLIDLTVNVTKTLQGNALLSEKMASFGHLGTHFDVMNKEFPLELTKRQGIVFDVAGIGERDVDVSDIDWSLIESGMFVAFRTGFIEKYEYGSREYFTSHPQLSDTLIEALLEKGVSLIGVDCAGVRRGAQHTPKDQYCADRGVFVIENLANLGAVLTGEKFARFAAHTYPIRFEGMTGLPCRVVAEL